MKRHDGIGLNDAKCLHADYFFARLAYWRDGRGLADKMCIKVARAQTPSASTHSTSRNAL